MSSEIITKLIESSHGVAEASQIELRADTGTGQVLIVVEKTIREYYKLTEYDKAKEMYEKLNRAGGRSVWKLEDLTK